jgi:hypothetical protein
VLHKPSLRWRRTLAFSGAAGLAWGGMIVHNLADLPHLTMTSPENAWPGAIWLLLVCLWATLPRRQWPVKLLLAWGTLNLVGGAASVLPLPFWPFVPEQSLRHYLFHMLYAGAQLPFLVLAGAELHRRPASPPPMAGGGT